MGRGARYKHASVLTARAPDRLDKRGVRRSFVKGKHHITFVMLVRLAIYKWLILHYSISREQKWKSRVSGRRNLSNILEGGKQGIWRRLYNGMH